jgi:hypothetical protein
MIADNYFNKKSIKLSMGTGIIREKGFNKEKYLEEQTAKILQ